MTFDPGPILHIAERHAGLLPMDANARARAVTWMFAAVSTMEPPIIEREAASYLERDRPWHAERLPVLEERIRERLGVMRCRNGARRGRSPS